MNFIHLRDDTGQSVLINLHNVCMIKQITKFIISVTTTDGEYIHLSYDRDKIKDQYEKLRSMLCKR
jgi:hypothetical protein